MGWFGTYCDEDLQSIRSVIEKGIDRKFDYEGNTIDQKMLYHSFKFGESYMAVQRDTYNDKNEKINHEVFAVVFLWRYSKKDMQVMVKTMDETMGPCGYKATKKLLKMLTPTDNVYAHNWRVQNWKKFKSIPEEHKHFKEEKKVI